MILSDADIERLCNPVHEHPLITPFKQEFLQPASVDLTLGVDFLELKGDSDEIIDLDDIKGTVEYRTILAPSGFVLMPSDFALGTTTETIVVPNHMVARIEGKSSLARIGLAIHITAGYCDPGFRGKVTLEFVNMSHRPMILRPGRPVCQVAFESLTNPAIKPYGSPGLNNKYQDQTTTTGSRYAISDTSTT